MSRLPRRACLALLTLPVLPAHAHPATPTDPQGLDAPNPLRVAPDLMCSGQPSRAGLQRLKALGFEAVLYLAPATVGDAIREEPELVRAQGLDFAHVPMVWDAPTLAQVDQVLDQLDAWRGRSVLLHCQVSMRASSLGFLHRVLRRREPPLQAWADVQKIWSPNKTWAGLIQQALRRAGVDFEPL